MEKSRRNEQAIPSISEAAHHTRFQTYKVLDMMTSAELPPVLERVRDYLDQGVDDPRYMSTVGMYDPEGVDDEERLRTISETVGHLRDRLYSIDYNAEYQSPIDQFIKKNDQSSPFSIEMRTRLEDNLKLRRETVYQLGFTQNDFNTVRFTAS
jgi:hypothetical protein